MDASQYMRRLSERCSKTVSRNNCVDASLYTQMKGLAATTTYISPVTTPGAIIASGSSNVVPPLACDTSSSAFGLGNSGSAYPVKLPASCPSQGVCEFFTNRYTTPTIQLPACEYTTFSTSYLRACVVSHVQGTTAEQSAAVKTRVDRDIHGCC